MKSNLVRYFASLMLSGSIGLPAVAQETASFAEALEHLQIARANTALFRIQYAETKEDIERVENPVLRYTEPVRGPTQGTVWLWGREGRPVAVLEMIREAGRQDWFCFHATSDEPIKLVGEYQVIAKLYTDVTATITVSVLGET